MTLHGNAAVDEVRLLVFDVFDTLVDRRSGIASEAHSALAVYGKSIEGAAFADAWRGPYQPTMDEGCNGRLPFSKLDRLHRRNLDRVLQDFGLDDVPEGTRADLNRARHRLDAWPNVEPGVGAAAPAHRRRHAAKAKVVMHALKWAAQMQSKHGGLR